MCKLAEGSQQYNPAIYVYHLDRRMGFAPSDLVLHIGPNDAAINLASLICTKDNLVKFIMSQATGAEQVKCSFGGVDCSKQDLLSALSNSVYIKPQLY